MTQMTQIASQAGHMFRSAEDGRTNSVPAKRFLSADLPRRSPAGSGTETGGGRICVICVNCGGDCFHRKLLYY